MMNSTSLFPCSIYGKLGNKSAMPEGYGWYHIDAEFPNEKLEIAKEYANSFQWLSGGNQEQYTQAVCWIGNIMSQNGGLFIIFRDVGKDDRKRPHTLRIEAYSIQEECIHKNPKIPFFLLCFPEMIKSKDIVNHEWIEQESENIKSLEQSLIKNQLEIFSYPVCIASMPLCFRLKINSTIIFLSRENYAIINANDYQNYTRIKHKQQITKYNNKGEGCNQIKKRTKGNITQIFVQFIFFILFTISIYCNYLQYNKIASLKDNVVLLEDKLSTNTSKNNKEREILINTLDQLLNEKIKLGDFITGSFNSEDLKKAKNIIEKSKRY